MDSAIILACVSGVIGICAASWTYFLTKRKDREEERRKLKIEYYKDFILSVSHTVMNPAFLNVPEEVAKIADAEKKFSDSCNTLIIVAPKKVVDALYDLRKEIMTPDPSRLNVQQKLYTKLLFAIREDIGIRNNDFNRDEFTFILWQ